MSEQEDGLLCGCPTFPGHEWELCPQNPRWTDQADQEARAAYRRYLDECDPLGERE